MDTTTFNFNLLKPEISGSPTTWGNKLNQNMDTIDGILAGLQSTGSAGGSNIGEVKMYAGSAVPVGWLLCDGTIYANSAIPLLAPILNNKFGGVAGTSNAVPNLKAKFPIGADGTAYLLGAGGGEATHVLTTAEMPAHNHTPTLSINDPGHSHGVNDPSHSHSINDPSHHHSLGTQLINLGGGGNGVTAFGAVGSQNTNDAGTGISINSAPTGVSVANSPTGITLSGTIATVGSNAAHNNVPPYVVLNFIIRYQ